MHEEWRPVVGYEGLYEVSSEGRVRNIHLNHVLTPWVNQDGYNQLGLRKDGKRNQRLVHRLVCEAFHGPAPKNKPLALHGIEGKSVNSARNLYWGSNSDNMRDRRRDGTDFNLSKTHCPQNHPYSGENLGVRPNGGRFCRECGRNRQRNLRNNGLDPSSDKHGTLSGYSIFSCRCEPCKVAYSQYGKSWRARKKVEKS